MGKKTELLATSLGLALLVGGTTFGVSAGSAADKALVGQTLVDEYVACWGHFNQRAWDKFAACYDKSSVSEGSGLPDVKGASAILEKHSKPFTAALSDVAGQQQLILVNGKNLASVTLLQGTHNGVLESPAGAIPATGKKIGMLVAHVIQSSGRTTAAKEWLVMDNGTFAAQLGLAKMPARAAIDKGASAPTVVLAVNSATEKQNLALARKLYRGFNQRDEAVLGLLAEDVIDANQCLPADVKGKPAVSELLKGFWQMSSNVNITMPAVFAAGDYVVGVGTFSGTNDGAHPGFGIPKTGKKFATRAIEITRWQDGKLREIWPFYDGADLARQLGLVPPPAKHASN